VGIVLSRKKGNSRSRCRLIPGWNPVSLPVLFAPQQRVRYLINIDVYSIKLCYSAGDPFSHLNRSSTVLPSLVHRLSGRTTRRLLALVLGLGLVLNRRLPPSSRHHESGVWQGLYRLEVELVSYSTRCNGKIGRCNGRKTRSCKRD
jgi:hypothetical protein